MQGSKKTPAEPVKAKAKAVPRARTTTPHIAKPRANSMRIKGQKGANTPSRADVFVREYLVDLNGKQAALRAGYGPEGARQRAAELMSTAPVQIAIQKAMDERATRTGITADHVLERWWAVATADARDLTEINHCCCRFCWGKDHHYQRTPQEQRDITAQYAREVAACGRDKALIAQLVVPDVDGGTNYDPTRDPNTACPECRGVGVQVVVAKDTRDLSPAARLLFAGVKTTQNGLEVKTQSQGDALTNVAKHLGMLATRLRVGDTDNPDDDQDFAGYVLIPAKKKVNGKAE